MRPPHRRNVVGHLLLLFGVEDLDLLARRSVLEGRRHAQIRLLLLAPHDGRGAVLMQVQVVRVELVVEGGGQVVDGLHEALMPELGAEQAVDDGVAAGGADGHEVGVELRSRDTASRCSVIVL